MMKYVATAAVAATFTASAAFAGGVAAPYIEPAPQVVYTAPAAVGGWSGGYVGGNLSFGKGKFEGEGRGIEDTRDSGDRSVSLGKPDGTSGALRLGYDWQRGAGVFGLGAEYNFGKYKDSIGPFDVEMKNAATVFARAGYALNDNFLAYGLLGYTWAKGAVSGLGDSTSADLKGGTIGLGGEYKFNQNWSSYAEYTYTDFGTVSEADGLKIKADLGQVKLGVNYRF